MDWHPKNVGALVDKLVILFLALLVMRSQKHRRPSGPGPWYKQSTNLFALVLAIGVVIALVVLIYADSQLHIFSQPKKSPYKLNAADRP